MKEKAKDCWANKKLVTGVLCTEHDGNEKGSRRSKSGFFGFTKTNIEGEESQWNESASIFM